MSEVVMKAALLYEGKNQLTIEDVPLREPQRGEVVVRVAACGVCHTDLHYIDHGVPTFQKPPIILGHEISGTVETLGPEVEGLEKEKRVIIPAVLTCGTCAFCREGRENLCQKMCMLGNHIDGGYAEFVVVPAKDLISLPEELPLQESAIIADALSTPYHAVVHRGEVKPGQVVSIFGCGGVGINVVQFAVLAGAEVIAVDISEKKLERAKEFGASQVFLSEEGVAKKIRKATGGCDVAFEVVGKPSVMQEAMNTLKPGGRFVMVGYSAEPLSLPASRIMFREIEIRGSLGCRPVDYHAIVHLVAMGKLKLTPLVSKKVPLEEINHALDDLRQQKEVIRNLVVFA